MAPEPNEDHQEFFDRMQEVFEWACEHEEIGGITAVAGFSIFADKKREDLAEATGIDKEEIDEIADGKPD